MSDDDQNYSRNIVQRRAVTTAVVVVCFVFTMTSVWVGIADLIDDRTDIDPVTEWLLVKGTAVLAGTLVTALAGVFATRLHRAFWPERPDAG
jgi:Na+/pantothenate symporter